MHLPADARRGIVMSPDVSNTTAVCPECGRDRSNREPHRPTCISRVEPANTTEQREKGFYWTQPKWDDNEGMEVRLWDGSSWLGTSGWDGYDGDVTIFSSRILEPKASATSSADSTLVGALDEAAILLRANGYTVLDPDDKSRPEVKEGQTWVEPASTRKVVFVGGPMRLAVHYIENNEQHTCLYGAFSGWVRTTGARLTDGW